MLITTLRTMECAESECRLVEALRGGNFRHAVEAVAALRRLDPATGAGLVPSTETKDEQRAFQLLVARLVAEGGVHGLAARWRELPSPQWREMLVSEIGQAFHLWVEEGTIELFLAALDDPDDKVARRAVKLLTSCLREPPAKAIARTLRRKAAPRGWDQPTGWRPPTACAGRQGCDSRLERCADIQRR